MKTFGKMLDDNKQLPLKIFIAIIIIFTIILEFKNTSDRQLHYQVTKPEEKVVKSKNVSLNNIDTTATKVMVVAHPDDETLWGSHAIYHDKYLVVCVTCGTRKDRVREFKRAMEATEDDYIMLNYPDLVNGKKSDWKKDWKSINSDVSKVINTKNWDMVVTHNPDGEYGHIHHKMTNRIVTSFADHDKLVYFGRFYWGKIPNRDSLEELSDEDFKFKTEVLIPKYVTQQGAIYNLRNMVHYESWITYKEWYGDDIVQNY